MFKRMFIAAAMVANLTVAAQAADQMVFTCTIPNAPE